MQNGALESANFNFHTHFKLLVDALTYWNFGFSFLLSVLISNKSFPVSFNLSLPKKITMISTLIKVKVKVSQDKQIRNETALSFQSKL